MSRVPRFRALLKERTLNHEPGYYVVTGIHFHEDYGGGGVWLCDKEGDEFSEYIEDVELEQDTGLRDKNGREIYEGDIVRGYFRFANKLRTGVVEYSDNYACYFFTGDCDSDEYLFNFSDLEVIGNIHENLELLNGKEGEK